jgi:hypothetical protein
MKKTIQVPSYLNFGKKNFPKSRHFWLPSTKKINLISEAIMMFFTNLLILAAICLKSFATEVVHEWVTLNYTWDAKHTYDNYIKTNKFIPSNCLLAGINVDIDGSIYLTVPRWKNGVPATLNRLETTSQTLTPFPSWDSQIEGDATGIQNVQSMTIDKNHKMWIVDVGRRNFFNANPLLKTSAPATVWIVDMNTKAVTDKYIFPSSIVDYSESFLNDVVVDEDRNFAYFSDAWGDGAIIVLNMNTHESRRYTGPSTQRDPSYSLIVNGHNYGKNIFTTPIDGIAITDDKQALFYCQVQGTTLYRLSTSILQNFTTTNTQIDAVVETLGTKEPSDGMKYLHNQLYWGALTISAYYTVTVNATNHPNFNTDVKVSESSPETMEWIDTFAIDLQSNQALYFVSNRLDQFMTGAMDFTGKNGANMRILRISA